MDQAFLGAKCSFKNHFVSLSVSLMGDIYIYIYIHPKKLQFSAYGQYVQAIWSSSDLILMQNIIHGISDFELFMEVMITLGL